MTAAEFKAWLEGYAESFASCGGAIAPADRFPDAEQWRVIKRRIASLQDTYTTHYHYPQRTYPTWTAAAGAIPAGMNFGAAQIQGWQGNGGITDAQAADRDKAQAVASALAIGRAEGVNPAKDDSGMPWTNPGLN